MKTHRGKRSSESLTGAKFGDPPCRGFPAGDSLMCQTSAGEVGRCHEDDATAL